MFHRLARALVMLLVQFDTKVAKSWSHGPFNHNSFVTVHQYDDYGVTCMRSIDVSSNSFSVCLSANSMFIFTVTFC